MDKHIIVVINKYNPIVVDCVFNIKNKWTKTFEAGCMQEEIIDLT